MPEEMLCSGNAGEIVHPAHRVERRNHAHALRVHHALNQRLANRLARLLHRRNRAGGNRFPQQPPCRFSSSRRRQMQQRNPPVNVPRAQQRADALRHHRRNARADHAPAGQDRHQQRRLSPAFITLASSQKDHRRFAVADAPERRRQNVVLEREQESDEDHLQIARRHRQNFTPARASAAAPARSAASPSRKAATDAVAAENDRRGDLAAQRILRVARAVKPAHQHRRADADARYAENDNRHHRDSPR